MEMTSVANKLLGAAAGAVVLLGLTLTASADIACSGGVCWHVTEKYEFPGRARVIVHPDDWRAGPREHFVFREHEGRGYWRGRGWTPF
jgi:hypothetical protein